MTTAQTVKSRQQILRFLKMELITAGIGEAEEEAQRILEEVLGITKTELYIDPEKEIPREAEKRSLEILAKRAKRIPLAYLLEKTDFWEETLCVNEGCLVPRPETEILVETVIKAITEGGHSGEFKGSASSSDFSFLDVGTGSGAIAVALLGAFENARGTLLDISDKALKIARLNIANCGLKQRTKLVKGDLFAPFGPKEKWDLIVSNPPYLSEADFLAVEPELKAEPRVALDGGKDGLDFYRRIIPAAKEHLKAGGMLALELGIGQAETVSKWLQEAGYDSIQRSRDYSGIDRVLTARFFPR